MTKTIKTEPKTEAEKICQDLCDLFADPSKWAFDAKGLGEIIEPIYMRARDVAYPHHLIAQSEYKTAHEFARELLLLPPHRVAVMVRVFDSPDEAQALPVTAEVIKIGGQNCVLIKPEQK